MKSQPSSLRAFRHLLVVLGVSALVCLPAQAEDKPLFESLRIGETVVKNVRVTRVTPVELIISGDGVSLIRLDRQDLPPELKALYPYDPNEAAEFKKLKADEQEVYARKEKLKQEQRLRDYKADLQRQQKATKDRIETIEKEAVQLRKEINHLKGKAKGTKPRSAAHMQVRQAKSKMDDLIHRKGEQVALLDKVNKQLDLMP